MAATTAPPSTSKALIGKRLPRWAPAAAGAGGLVLALVANVLTPVDGVAGTLIVAILLYLVIQTGWSFVVEGRRLARDRLATTGVYATLAIAAAPLLAVLATVLTKGLGSINAEFLNQSTRQVPADNASLPHALIGTLEQVGLAALIAVPLGILAAIYLVEYSSQTSTTRLASGISFCVDVMTGVPSIIIGLFVYTSLILTLGLPRSGFMASIALAILMIPAVVRSTEEMLRIIPRDVRETSLALGIPRWRTTVKVVLPNALAGIITGAILSIARVTGETAPLLLTTVVAQTVNDNPFEGPQTSLPTYIWDQFTSGTQASQDKAWGGALVLIVLVIILFGTARILARATRIKKS
jgi:phosphate transport system permease protein